MFRELSDDIQNLVDKSEFMTQAKELEQVRKDISGFIAKDEVVNRFYSYN